MLPKSYRSLRAVSFFAFLVALLLFILSQAVTVASRRVPVRDSQHQIIGEVWIPHDYGSDTYMSFGFLVLSGIQFWMVCVLGKKLSSEPKQ